MIAYGLIHIVSCYISTFYKKVISVSVENADDLRNDIEREFFVR